MWLEITTALPCINQCWYCPQEVLKEAYKGNLTLSLDDFKRYLENVHQDVDIHFAGFGEPFQNPSCLDMMEHAHAKGHQLTVFTTLVGLKEHRRFLDIPFRKIRVHDIGQDIPQAFKQYASPVVNVISRAGNVWKRDEKDVTKCSRVTDLNANVMLPNGDVVLCCMDYGLTTVLGNLGVTRFESLPRRIGTVCRTCEHGG